MNVAHMTLGEYPDGVPRGYLIPLEPFRSAARRRPVPNVAGPVGLIRAGRTWPAAASSTTSTATAGSTSSPPRPTPRCGCGLFVNRGDGTFEDRSHAAGLERPGRLR